MRAAFSKPDATCRSMERADLAERAGADDWSLG
jgi:hypothetical protein